MAATSTTTRPNEGIATAFLALCLGAAAMGVSPIFVRFAAADVGPYASAFWRVALALPVLYVWMRFEEAKAPSGPRPKSFTKPILLAGLAFSGDLFFWHLSILNTTVANATFFATTAPLFVVLITWLVLRRHVERATLAGLALCLAGGVALIGGSLKVDPARLWGDAYGVATAFFFGLYFIAVERARQDTRSGPHHLRGRHHHRRHPFRRRRRPRRADPPDDPWRACGTPCDGVDRAMPAARAC